MTPSFWSDNYFFRQDSILINLPPQNIIRVTLATPAAAFVQNNGFRSSSTTQRRIPSGFSRLGISIVYSSQCVSLLATFSTSSFSDVRRPHLPPQLGHLPQAPPWLLLWLLPLRDSFPFSLHLLQRHPSHQRNSFHRRNHHCRNHQRRSHLHLSRHHRHHHPRSDLIAPLLLLQLPYHPCRSFLPPRTLTPVSLHRFRLHLFQRHPSHQRISYHHRNHHRRNHHHRSHPHRSRHHRNHYHYCRFHYRNHHHRSPQHRSHHFR